MPGHLVAVVGGKGGVGKSVFAANLAIAHMQNFKQRPLIVDLDLTSLGDQNLILGQNPQRSIVDVSKLPVGPMDPKTLAPFMVNAPQGYHLIGAPRDSILASDLDGEGLSRFLKSVTNIFDFVVVDCGSSMDSHTMRVLEYATAIFVVTTPDLIVMNQTKRVIARIQELLFPPQMVQIIVNKLNAGSLYNPAVIQKNLNREVFAVLPDEPSTCDGCLSKSTPLTILAPGTPLARAYNDLVRKMQQTDLLKRLAQLKKPTGVAAHVAAKAQDQSSVARSGDGSPFGRSRMGSVDAWTALKIRLLAAIQDKLDLKKMNFETADPKQREVIYKKTEQAVLEALPTEDAGSILQTRELKQQIVREVLDEALGFGPLEDLLSDDTVTEIMVNARDQIFIEKSGKPTLSKVTFTTETQMRTIIDRIVAPLGRQVNESSPYVDARLPDGSRVHIIIPPLALRGPTITIRKFPKHRLTYKDLVGKGSMTEEIADFLRICVEGKLNVVVSGGTGSGKTTLLNVLSSFIPSSDRVITVEDSAELQLVQEHVVRLEARPKNIEGKGEVSIRDLVKNCLRMRPDRIVVGEIRDGAAIDMLQAMNTGHAGSMTTVHSNNPRECIGRLETLCTMAGLGLPSKALKETIASAVNLIIQQSRLSDGSRKVTYISEVTGMQGEVISLQDIFYFKQEGLDKNRKVIGRYVPTGFIPKFVEEMEAKGMKISRGLFAVK
jgi:septum site-determining protein MinD